jgi:hypothetical protein
MSLCQLKFPDNQQFTGPEIAISRSRRLTLNSRHKRGLRYVARLLASMEGVCVVFWKDLAVFDLTTGNRWSTVVFDVSLSAVLEVERIRLSFGCACYRLSE